MYIFKKVILSVRQLVCESRFRWNSIPQNGDRLSENINQVENFLPGEETRCVSKLLKWNKDPATRRQLV